VLFKSRVGAQFKDSIVLVGVRSDSHALINPIVKADTLARLNHANPRMNLSRSQLAGRWCHSCVDLLALLGCLLFMGTFRTFQQGMV
jgi:hypothetical protein